MFLRTFALVTLLAASSSLRAAGPPVTLPSGETVQLPERTLSSLPKQTVSATSHGKTASYEGYELLAVLRAAGVQPTESLLGKALGMTVTVSAADGYRVIFALSELDPTLGNRHVLLVDREKWAASSGQ
jgi:hypothetical protein